jgi:putative SOS response-associated peptidase YedK
MKEKPKAPHINARAETVHKLPLFREGFAKRRCLIPATGFYEWQKREDGKQPYRFRRKDLEPFAFAGIWEFVRLGGEEILSTAMIVGEANPLVGGVHDRMPVMLMSEDYDRWLVLWRLPACRSKPYARRIFFRSCLPLRNSSSSTIPATNV